MNYSSLLTCPWTGTSMIMSKVRWKIFSRFLSLPRWNHLYECCVSLLDFNNCKLWPGKFLNIALCLLPEQGIFVLVKLFNTYLRLIHFPKKWWKAIVMETMLHLPKPSGPSVSHLPHQSGEMVQQHVWNFDIMTLVGFCRGHSTSADETGG